MLQLHALLHQYDVQANWRLVPFAMVGGVFSCIGDTMLLFAVSLLGMGVGPTIFNASEIALSACVVRHVVSRSRLHGKSK